MSHIIIISVIVHRYISLYNKKKREKARYLYVETPRAIYKACYRLSTQSQTSTTRSYIPYEVLIESLSVFEILEWKDGPFVSGSETEAIGNRDT